MHLVDKITQIHSQLEIKHGASPLEIPWEFLTQLSGKSLILLDLRKVNRVLGIISIATLDLDPCPSWQVEVAQEMTCRWI